MDSQELRELLAGGETTTVQFQENLPDTDRVAATLSAFSNGEGGVLIFGVRVASGEAIGLDDAQLEEISRVVTATAACGVHPAVTVTPNRVRAGTKTLLVFRVPPGCRLPYMDERGNIWVRQGAGNRRAVGVRDISRLCRVAGYFRPDSSVVPGSGTADLDLAAVRSLVESLGQLAAKLPYDQLLRRLQITDAAGRLTLAGLLFFGVKPQRFIPTLSIRATRFAGNEAHRSHCLECRDISGNLPRLYKRGLAWLKSCLSLPQSGQRLTHEGISEPPVPEIAELLQNALVHRDLLLPEPVQLLVFNNRVEIVSPGCIAGGYRVDEISMGFSWPRNHLLYSFSARCLPFNGKGCGLLRARQSDFKVTLTDDRDGNQFTACVFRRENAVPLS